MNTTYEITFKSQLFILKELFYRAIVFLLGYFILYQVDFVSLGSKSSTAYFFLIFYFTCELIPSSILHYQYYKYNKYTKVNLNTTENTLTIISLDSTKTFHFNQIKNVTLALVSSLYRGRKGGWSSWDLYHYAFLETENGEQFVITCLLMNDLRELFKVLESKTTKYWVFFPLIIMSNFRNNSSQ
jgi:hypothetical protein